MALEMPAYLKSDVVHWTMERADLPRLTIGGYLMRQHRLQALLPQLEPTERALFRLACNWMEKLFTNQTVRFEERAHQELRARLGEWMGHLRHWSASGILRASDYTRECDTRVVITALVDQLRAPPFQLDGRFPPQLAAVDRHLHHCWLDGPFVWAKLWQPAYPADIYWWLYGRPECQSENERQFKMELPTLEPIN
jgi:hypothetical protein